jgi:hypothetical protein
LYIIIIKFYHIGASFKTGFTLFFGGSLSFLLIYCTIVIASLLPTIWECEKCTIHKENKSEKAVFAVAEAKKYRFTRKKIKGKGLTSLSAEQKMAATKEKGQKITKNP